MNQPVHELHPHSVGFDALHPEEFEGYFASLDYPDQQQVASILLRRFHLYAKQTIAHHDQAVAGMAADQYELSPTMRERRQQAEMVFEKRRISLENLQALCGIALRHVELGSIVK